VTSLLLLGALVGGVQDTLQITFIGNAAFELTDGETTLVTDLPYQSGAFRYMTYDLDAVEPQGDVISVVTHRHDDHFDPTLFLQQDWSIIGPEEVTQGFPADRVIALAPVIQAGPFTIRPLRTSHRDTEHYSYLITWRGRRLYFTGDTEDPSNLLTMEQLDVAFVTSWLLCAAAVSASIPADQVILHHQYPDARPPTCAHNVALDQGESFRLVAATHQTAAP